MKGTVFTELLELIEDKFGLDTVDEVLMRSNLESDGVYTAVGTYHHTEALEIVTHLSAVVNVPVPKLVRVFGNHLFYRFVEVYPDILKNLDSSVSLLANVEDFIHVEVRKLYPDAELPTLEFVQVGEKTWQMTYISTRPFPDLAHGLIEACVEHFGVKAEISREDLPVETGAKSRFTLEYEKAIAPIEQATT